MKSNVTIAVNAETIVSDCKGSEDFSSNYCLSELFCYLMILVSPIKVKIILSSINKMSIIVK